MKRPAAIAGMALLGALVFCCLCGFTFAVSFGAASLLGAVALILLYRRVRLYSLILCLTVVFIACGFYCLRSAMQRQPVLQYEDQTLAVTATAGSRTVYDDEYAQLELRISTLSGQTAPDGMKVRVYAQDLPDCESGDTVVGTLHFYRSENALTADDPDGVFLRAYPDGTLSVTGRGGFSVMRLAERSREFLHGTFYSHLDGETAGLLSAVLLGEKNGLSGELTAQMKTAGVSHLAAVSGLHVTLVAQLFLLLLGWIVRKKRLAAILTLIPVWMFVLIVGLPFSAIRAAIMFTVLAAAPLFNKQADGISSLGVATVIILMADPFAALDIGFLSSFASTLGILLLQGPLERKMLSVLPAVLSGRVWVGRICAALAVTESAVVGLLPCIVIWYGQISLIAPLTNLLLIPLLPLLFCFGLMGGILSGSAFLSLLWRPLLLCAGGVARYVLWIIRFFSGLPFAAVPVASRFARLWAGLCFCFAAAGVMLVCSGARRFRMVRLTAVLCTLTLVFCVIGNAAGYQNRLVLFVADERGEPAVLVCTEGKTAAVCFDEKGAAAVQRLARDNGFRSIDLLICDDEEHALSAAEKLSAERILTPRDSTAEALGKTGFTFCGGSVMITYGEFRAAVLPSDAEAPARCVLLISPQAARNDTLQIVCCGRSEYADARTAGEQVIPTGGYGTICVSADRNAVLSVRRIGGDQ